MALDSEQKFSHSVANEADWDPGLREYFNYRDLGIKDASGGDVIAHVVKAKEGHDATGQWFRAYGNELWEFDEEGLMRRREASINDVPIDEQERKFRWPANGPRPSDDDGIPSVQ